MNEKGFGARQEKGFLFSRAPCAPISSGRNPPRRNFSCVFGHYTNFERETDCRQSIKRLFIVAFGT